MRSVWTLVSLTVILLISIIAVLDAFHADNFRNRPFVCRKDHRGSSQRRRKSSVLPFVLRWSSSARSVQQPSWIQIQLVVPWRPFGPPERRQVHQGRQGRRCRWP